MKYNFPIYGHFGGPGVLGILEVPAVSKGTVGVWTILRVLGIPGMLGYWGSRVFLGY